MVYYTQLGPNKAFEPKPTLKNSPKCPKIKKKIPNEGIFKNGYGCTSKNKIDSLWLKNCFSTWHCMSSYDI